MSIRFSVESEGVTRTFELSRAVVTFGRSKECTVQIDDPALSRTHFQLELEADGVWVRDLNSRNGTLLGSEKVTRCKTQAGDVIQVGHCFVRMLEPGDPAGLTTVSKAPTAHWTRRLFAKARVGKRRPPPSSERELADDLHRLQKLLGLLRRITSEFEPERVLSEILDAALEFLEAERGFLVTVEEDRLFIPVARDFWKKDIPSPAFELSRTVALEVVRHGITLVTEDATEDPRFEEMASIHDLQIRSVLCVPLKDGRGRVTGAIYLDNRFSRGRFNERDAECMEAFAAQAALALERSGVFETLRSSSLRYREAASRNALELRELKARLRQMEQQQGFRHDFSVLVGRSDAMRDCLKLVDKVIDTDLSVLLRGESGTGKDVLARLIHQQGPRGEGPFVVADLAALPGGLVERELFGHAAGAFSGAGEAATGLIAAADGGTLFLDEIGDLPPETQKSLLRVLEGGEVRPLGATRSSRVDLRIIAATHRDLEKACLAGQFREDLYYRLKGIEIQVPPLRDRVEDLPVLIEHFMARAGVLFEFSPKAWRRLVRHTWPGNVRELQNELVRLGLLGRSRINATDLSLALRDAPREFHLGEGGLKAEVDALERRLIQEALAAENGNKTRAARTLGLSRVGLRKKMERLGIEG